MLKVKKEIYFFIFEIFFCVVYMIGNKKKYFLKKIKKFDILFIIFMIE